MAVPVTSVQLIEDALGRSLSETETQRASYYINAISAFIASYCDLISFEEVVNDQVRLQADYYGIIELGGGPISEVTSVASVDGSEVGGWTFDGTRMIVGLAPFQTVDITYTHGAEEVPEDLQGVATDAVLEALSLNSPGPLKTRTVGDVTYAFHEGANIGVSLADSVMSRYRTSEWTWRTGPHNASGMIYPINWFQIGR